MILDEVFFWVGISTLPPANMVLWNPGEVGGGEMGFGREMGFGKGRLRMMRGGEGKGKGGRE